MENLLITWEKFLRGKRRKKDVILFQIKLGDNLAGLYRSLVNHTYKHGPYLEFNISDPKPRKIHKATVRDRVFHHLLHKELYPYFDKKFIYDSYSCRKEKGVHRALNRFKFFAGKVSKNNSRTCYALKCDIKKFFASVNHEALIKILRRHIKDQNIIDLLNKVVSSFYATGPGVGLPLGNLTSQLLANVYMHEFDMFIKQGLRVKYYIRYTDDFIILSDDRKYLVDLLPKIEEFLKIKLKLSLHKNKVYIKTHASGVDFLGWIHFSRYRQIRTSTKRKVIKKLKGYPKPQTAISYRGLLEHGNTYKLRQKVGLV
jgi:RNA-directed DNA polymerase